MNARRSTDIETDEPQSWHDAAPFLWSMYAALCFVVAVKFAMWLHAQGWL